MNSQPLLVEDPHLPLVWNAVMRYGLGISVLIFYFTAIMHFRYTPDDTYIYLQFAKNLAGGSGFSFNAGIPTFGVTGPLWVALLAAGERLGLDPYVVAKTFDIIFASFSIVLLQLLAVVIIKDRLYAFFAAWIFSFDAWLLRWSSSGMETSLAILLGLLTVWYAFHRDYYLAFFTCALLTLVRPEGIILFAVLVLDNFIDVRRHRAPVRYLLLAPTIYVLMVGGWLAYSYAQFGTIIPNTLASKSGGAFDIRHVAASIFDIAAILGTTQATSVLVLLVTFWLVVSKAGFRDLWDIAFPIVWIVFLLAAYVVRDVQVLSRYILPVTPLIILYALWGLKRIEEGWKIAPAVMRRVLLAVAILSLVQNTYIYRSQVVPHVVGFTAGMNQCIRPIAYWLRTNSPREATVVAPDVGLLGYVSDRTIYDPAGLISPELREAFRPLTYDQGMVSGRYRRLLRPDFVVDRASVRERLTSDSLRPVISAEFPGLAIRNPQPVYYTLYRTVK